MKKLALSILTILFFSINAFSVNHSNKTLEETDYYLTNTSVKVGTFNGNSFTISKDIVGESILNGEISVKIESYEIIETNDNDLKYLVIHGVSFEKDPDGKDSKAFYKIAFPISSIQSNATSVTTNTCKSYDSIIFGCSCCSFIKNSKGEITGCKCCEFGWCTHEVTNTSAKVSLAKIFES